MKYSSILLLMTIVILKSNIAFAELSVDLTSVSDRLLRGFSLSDEEPSLYGGLHYMQKNTGTYGHAVVFSNIQIHGEEELQADIVAGHKFDMDNFAWDIGYVRHVFSKVDDVDSGEWFVGTVFKNYSLHYYDNNELNERYIDFNSHFIVGKNYKMMLHAGNLDSEQIDEKDFTDYSVGLFRDVKNFNVGVTYAYNDNKGVLEPIAGSHLVLSLSKVW